MNPKLKSISEKAAAMLKASIVEAGDDIIEAWDLAVEEAQSQDKDPVLSLGFSVKLDLGASKLTTCLSFGVRRKYESAAEIPDPNQTELGIGNE